MILTFHQIDYDNLIRSPTIDQAYKWIVDFFEPFLVELIMVKTDCKASFHCSKLPFDQ